MMERNSPPHKALIVNVHSSDNAGDLALLEQTIAYLEMAYGNLEVSVCSNWPDENALLALQKTILPSPWRIIGVWNSQKKPRFQVLSFLAAHLYLLIYIICVRLHLPVGVPRIWRQLFDAYRATDIVVAVSGNQLFSHGKFGWPLPVVGMPIFLGLAFHKPVLIFPQSVGPFRYRWEEWMVRFLYDRVDRLFIRDMISLERVERIGIRKSKPQFLPDIAFTLPAEAPDRAKEILHPYGFLPEERALGLTIISNMPSYLPAEVIENYYQNLAQVICKMVGAHAFRVFLFLQVLGPTDQENDRIGTAKVLSLIPDELKQRVAFVDRQLTPAELKVCYGLMDLFLATRLHSGIFSLAMRVPTLFIGYLDKTMGMLRSVNLDEYYFSLSEVDAEKIALKLIEMWENKDFLVATINKKLEGIETTLSQFPDTLKEDNQHE